jgi:hypothetical protein
MAVRRFGQELVDALPRYVRGKHTGKTKAFMTWNKVESGGWARNAYGGYVERRVGKSIDVVITTVPDWRTGKATTLIDENANCTPEQRLATVRQVLERLATSSSA